MRLGEAIGALGRPIAVYPALMRKVGLAPGILLCQLAYWHGKQHDPDGWIRKSWSELEEETSLTRRQQQSAREELKAQGLIEERVRGVPATTEFRIVLDVLDALFGASQLHDPVQPVAPNGATECTQTCNQLHPEVQLDAPVGATSNESETTTETTTEMPAAPADVVPSTDEGREETPEAPAEVKPQAEVIDMASAGKKKKSGSHKAKGLKVLFPDDFKPTPARLALIARVGCRNPMIAWEDFESHHRKNATRSASWPDSWKTWYCNHDRYGCRCQREPLPPPAQGELGAPVPTTRDGSPQNETQQERLARRIEAEKKAGTYVPPRESRGVSVAKTPASTPRSAPPPPPGRRATAFAALAEPPPKRPEPRDPSLPWACAKCGTTTCEECEQCGEKRCRDCDRPHICQRARRRGGRR